MKQLRGIFAAGLVVMAGSAYSIVFDDINPGGIGLTWSGSGTAADPYVLNETITDPNLAEWFVGVRGFGDDHPNEEGKQAYFKKKVTNMTGTNLWLNFENELGFMKGKDQNGDWRIYGQESLTFKQSKDNDGLSFAQGQDGRIQGSITVIPNVGAIGDDAGFRSSEWTRVFIDEQGDRDFNQFFGGGGVVEHGETVEIKFWITDNLALDRDEHDPDHPFKNDKFVIRQSVNVQVVPEPATMCALAGGAFALIARRRRRK